MPVGWRLILYFLLAIIIRQIWLNFLEPLLYYLLTLRKLPWRRVVVTDNQRFNRYVLEGFINYGPRWITLLAGLLSGLLIPIFTLLLYGAVALNYIFLLSITDSYMTELLYQNYMRALIDNLVPFAVFALCALLYGFTFGLVRIWTVARYVRYEGRRRQLLWSSEFWGVLQGWFVYWLWAMWPRASGLYNYSRAITVYFWLWVTFGLIYGWYFRSIHDFFLWRLIRKRWKQGVCYTALRILAAIDQQSEMDVDVAADGTVSIKHVEDPVTQERLKDLLNYFPGIKRYRFTA